MNLSLPTTTNLFLVLLILIAIFLTLNHILQLLKRRHDTQVRQLEDAVARFVTELGRMGMAAERLKTQVERAVMQDAPGAGGGCGVRVKA